MTEDNLHFASSPTVEQAEDELTRKEFREQFTFPAALSFCIDVEAAFKFYRYRLVNMDAFLDRLAELSEEYYEIVDREDSTVRGTEDPSDDLSSVNGKPRTDG